MRFRVSFLFFLINLFAVSGAYADWAVIDQTAVDELKDIKRELEKINNVSKTGNRNAAELQGSLKKTSESFHQLSISTSEKEKYIKTEASCGDRSVNRKYFDACIGRRNLAINALMQYDVHLDKMGKHLEAIESLLSQTDSIPKESGVMQRYHAEITARQALMLGEAARMQGLMEAYKQRDQLYALQMAEARESALSKPPVNTESGGARPRPSAPAFRAPTNSPDFSD